MRLTPLYATLLFCFCINLCATSLQANPPRKLNIGVFSKLINNSPFTIKPEVKSAVAESPLERDWSLGSISPSGDEFSVTLINKKNRKDRIRFIPGFSSGDYKLLEVKQDADSKSNSKVYIQKGSQKAWITYDDSVLKLKTASAGRPKPVKTSSTTAQNSNAKPPIPSLNGNTSNSQSDKKTEPVRRVRRVPTVNK